MLGVRQRRGQRIGEKYSREEECIVKQEMENTRKEEPGKRTKETERVEMSEWWRGKKIKREGKK